VIIVTLIHAAINSGQYKLALSLTAELKVSKGAVKCMLFVDIIIMADSWPFYFDMSFAQVITKDYNFCLS